MFKLGRAPHHPEARGVKKHSWSVTSNKKAGVVQPWLLILLPSRN